MYFWGAKSDFAGALKYYQRAYSLAESIGYPTMIGYYALAGMSNMLIFKGKLLSALAHAKEAHRYAEHIGDVYAQAWSLYLQAKCHRILANYQHDQFLLQKSTEILTACGQQQSTLGLSILNLQAEVHLLKSEYLQSRNLQVAIASNCQPTSYYAILANLTIACIDIATGADSKLIHQNPDTCFALSQDVSTELVLLCLEKLGDLSTSMNDISTTLQWAGVFLSLAYCMVQIADILNGCGEAIKAIELWKAARPLFECSSQMKDIIKVDKKLAEVDSAVFVKYEEQLQHLPDVPVNAPEEEEEAEGIDFGDKGTQGILV
ncbi:hypothetical protein C8J57DRAFT_1242935 [Mycena rebaudengoi]|nr:hypothetical protein C8J57DRAFT_1242935 [Mycena rebaudengoi]